MQRIIRHLFYLGNFCSQCGERLAPEGISRLGPGYLCRHCIGRLHAGRGLRALALITVLAIAALGLHRLSPPLGSGPQPPSAHDASPLRSPAFESEPTPMAFCGALTRRGTPCRRRVLPGRRCAQHRASR